MAASVLCFTSRRWRYELLRCSVEQYEELRNLRCRYHLIARGVTEGGPVFGMIVMRDPIRSTYLTLKFPDMRVQVVAGNSRSVSLDLKEHGRYEEIGDLPREYSMGRRSRLGVSDCASRERRSSGDEHMV